MNETTTLEKLASSRNDNNVPKDDDNDAPDVDNDEGDTVKRNSLFEEDDLLSFHPTDMADDNNNWSEMFMNLGSGGGDGNSDSVNPRAAAIGNDGDGDDDDDVDVENMNNLPHKALSGSKKNLAGNYDDNLVVMSTDNVYLRQSVTSKVTSPAEVSSSSGGTSTISTSKSLSSDLSTSRHSTASSSEGKPSDTRRTSLAATDTTTIPTSRVRSSSPGNSWHDKEVDEPQRVRMVQDIAHLLYARKKIQQRPDEKLVARLKAQARVFESQLYKTASSLEEYKDRTSLKRRIAKLAEALASHFKQAKKQGVMSSSSTIPSLTTTLSSLKNQGNNNKDDNSSVAIAAASSTTTKNNNLNTHSSKSNVGSMNFILPPHNKVGNLRREQSLPTKSLSLPSPISNNNFARGVSDSMVSSTMQSSNNSINSNNSTNNNNNNNNRLGTNFMNQQQQMQANSHQSLQQQMMATYQQQQQQQQQQAFAGQLNMTNPQMAAMAVNNPLFAAQATATAMMGGNGGLAMFAQMQRQQQFPGNPMNGVNMLHQQQQQQQQQQQAMLQQNAMNMNMFNQRHVPPNNNVAAMSVVGGSVAPVGGGNMMSMSMQQQQQSMLNNMSNSIPNNNNNNNNNLHMINNTMNSGMLSGMSATGMLNPSATVLPNQASSAGTQDDNSPLSRNSFFW